MAGKPLEELFMLRCVGVAEGGVWFLDVEDVWCARGDECLDDIGVFPAIAVPGDDTEGEFRGSVEGRRGCGRVGVC
jgi:hypothetical protein